MVAWATNTTPDLSGNTSARSLCRVSNHATAHLGILENITQRQFKMNTSIQTLSFQNFPVSFRADGYLNATEIAEHFGKRINNYLRNERTQEYISALIEFLNIPETRNRATVENQLVITQKGGNDKSAQGTWLHPKLAIDFARWLNPKFAVWCDMQIEKILHQSSSSLKPDALKTQTALPNGLTLEQQGEIKKFHHQLVQTAPNP